MKPDSRPISFARPTPFHDAVASVCASWMTSRAASTAVAKPKLRHVHWRSLSIVFGMPTTTGCRQGNTRYRLDSRAALRASRSGMSPTARPIPEGYEHATPYLCIRGAARALDFYAQAFGAVESLRIPAPGGKLGHAEMRIGRALVMLADEAPEYGYRSPETLGGSPVTIHVYVEDVDALVRRAVAAGAKLTEPVTDKFYGDRSGKLTDPFGHVWVFSTHQEDV